LLLLLDPDEDRLLEERPDDFELLPLLRFTEDPLLPLLEFEERTLLEERLLPDDDRLRTVDPPERVALLTVVRTNSRPMVPKIFFAIPFDDRFLLLRTRFMEERTDDPLSTFRTRC
jgi:hypothetical protein